MRRGVSKSYCTHSSLPLWSHQVNRGMEWSLEFLGGRPSLRAVVVSLGLVCEAVGGGGGLVHSLASGPPPMTGKEEIRKRAAPMGMSVIVSNGWSDLMGLSWSLPIIPVESGFQLG